MAKQIVHKELRSLVKEIEDLGFTTNRDNGNHIKVYTQQGVFVYSLPSTPGRGRWRQNLLSELRKRLPPATGDDKENLAGLRNNAGDRALPN